MGTGNTMTASAGAALQCGGGAVLQHAAVGQAGERVVGGIVGVFAGQLFKLGV